MKIKPEQNQLFRTKRKNSNVSYSCAKMCRTFTYMKKRVEINSLSYLRGLQLANPVTPDKKFNISLLVGADYYWSLVQNEIIRGD